MKRTVYFTILSFAVLLISGCATHSLKERADLEQAGDLPVMCKAGADCDKKWSLAAQWIAQHSNNIPVQSADLIETKQPHGLDRNAAFTASKTLDKDDIYKINFKATCNNWFGCTPSTIDANADFVNFVTALPVDASKPKLGIRVHPISAATALSKGIPDTNGIVAVVQVTPKSVADKAGILAGDLIAQYDGKSAATEDELRALIADTSAGQQVNILVVRGNEKKILKAVM